MTVHTTDDNKKVIAEYFAQDWSKGNVDVGDTAAYGKYLSELTCRLTSSARRTISSTHARASPRPRCLQEDAHRLSHRVPRPDFWAVGPLIAENTPEGEFVVGRWDGGTTHTGPAFADLALGKLDDASTCKKIRFTGTSVFRMEVGMIKEEIGEEGALRACSQLGIVGPLRWT